MNDKILKLLNSPILGDNLLGLNLIENKSGFILFDSAFPSDGTMFHHVFFIKLENNTNRCGIIKNNISMYIQLEKLFLFYNYDKENVPHPYLKEMIDATLNEPDLYKDFRI